VKEYENKAGRYETNQKYEYDDLYQLIGASGDSTQHLYDSGSIEGYRADYEQTFEYDIIGNMTKKTSRESKTQQVKNGMSLNYEFDYQYYGNSHKAERIGDMYYRYDGNGNVVEERYGGHSDHLGSAQLTTTRSGELHERIEYTPYGEIWVEHKYDYTEGSLPYRFTGKELDEETGYYYYGARYLDPRTSRWISTDPAMGDYIPSAPVDDEARKRNGNLPGMGGLFNVVNMHVYHYAGNNPIKYIDPDGRDGERPRHNADPMYIRVLLNTTHTYSISNRISMQDAFNSDDGPCTFRSLLGIAESRVGRNLTMSELNKARKKYYGSNENSDWTVDIGRADGKNLSGTPLADVINIGLELLGSKERASYINKEDPLSIPEGTQATLLRIDADTSSGYHFLEGDANGNKIFEPLQRMDDYKDSPVNRISSFKFYTPQKQE